MFRKGLFLSLVIGGFLLLNGYAFAMDSPEDGNHNTSQTTSQSENKQSDSVIDKVKEKVKEEYKKHNQEYKVKTPGAIFGVRG